MRPTYDPQLSELIHIGGFSIREDVTVYFRTPANHGDPFGYGSKFRGELCDSGEGRLFHKRWAQDVVADAADKFRADRLVAAMGGA